jgi:hypothetical protein
MELIIGSLVGAGLLLVGHLGVLVHDRLMGHGHKQR